MSLTRASAPEPALTTSKSNADVRAQSPGARLALARRRHRLAQVRDAEAAARDRAAALRDAAMAEHDAEIGWIDAGHSPREHGQTTTSAGVLSAAAQQRARTAQLRARAAEPRSRAAEDRRTAARDRADAAEERRAVLADLMELARAVVIAETDQLTGARTRSAGLADLERELERARREGRGLAAAYLDVVGLKALNDTEGHGAGDALLRAVVAVLRESLRAYDIVIRLGGDEFLCVMPGMTMDGARRRFTAIAAALALREGNPEVTAGFAVLRPGDDGAAELIRRADDDMLARRRDDQRRGALQTDDDDPLPAG